MPDRIVVRVPATVANIGPGFDCLGMALAWHNEVRVERGGEGELVVTATGPGADSMPRDATNLVVRGMAAAGATTSGIRINQLIAIAAGRGFGSSAAAICAGLVAGAAMAETPVDLLDLAIEIEGHADNVAPCLLGGITVSAGGRTKRLEPPEDLLVLALIAPTRLPTDVARAALGDSVERGAATATIGRAALLAAALATDDGDLLFDATEDVYHQPRRFELMPDSQAVVASLRAQGVAAFLSGAGPSVAALVRRADAGSVEARARSAAPEGWDVRVIEFDRSGTTIVDRR